MKPLPAEIHSTCRYDKDEERGREGERELERISAERLTSTSFTETN